MRAHKFVFSVALVAAALFTSSSLRSAAFVGNIAGTITTEAALPIAGISVSAYNSAGVWVASAVTGGTGGYSISGLADGTYFVRTFNTLGYVDELHDGFNCLSCSVLSGTPVTVLGGPAIVDFELAQGGGISGTVSTGGAPLASVQVTIVDAGNLFVASASSVAGGAFATTTGLPAGTYFARTSASGAYINEVWNNVPCQLSCSLTSATPIVVTAAAVTSGISFDLDLGAQFSGTVTDGAVGLVGVSVEVRNMSNQQVAFVTTTAGGAYTTSPGIPAGDYFLKTSNTAGYINELNDGSPCIGFCDVEGRTPVTATAGVVNGPVNFALAAGSRISGTVLDDTLAAPLVGSAPTVNILSSTGSQMTFAFADLATGAYISRDGLPAGTYYASTSNGSGYINELYNGVTCAPSCTIALGTPIVVPAATTVPGINFTLTKGAQITGKVTGTGGEGLSGVSVQVVNAGGTPFSSGFTGANGSYTTGTGLPTGSYYLRTTNGRGLINEVYPDIPCQGTLCPAGVGTPVGVTAGNPPVTVDMDLAMGGRIAGTVADAGSSAPIFGAFVQIYSATGQFLGSSQTDALGNYISGAGLTTGSFYVQTSNTLGYINERFDNVPCGSSCALTSGTAVGVITGVVTPDIDFGLALGGTVSGQVTDGVNPLANLSVQIVNTVTNATTTDLTDALGNFSVRGLADGTYYARTSNTQGYINEVYDNLQCPLNCFNILGAPLVIAAANTVAGVNFALEAGGRISGVVTDDALLPIAGVSVSVVDLSGLTAATGTTDALGQYISGAGLAAGNYYVRTNNGSGYVNELFDNIPCATGCTLATGTTVAVSAGTTTSGINFSLGAGGRVSGQAIDTATLNPIQGIFVQIYDAAGRQVGGASTDASGNFVTGSGLTTGLYYARTSNSLGYADELYNNKPCIGSCSVLAGDAFTVTQGVTTGGINFSLTQGGRVSGTITDAGTGAPIVAASVSVYDSTGRFITSGGANQFGVYTTGAGLSSGTYYARTNNGAGYVNELSGGAACVGACVVTTGTPIVVTSPATTTGVDFQLAAGGRITGVVTEAGGGPLAGVSVLVFNSAGQSVSGSSTNSLGIYRTSTGLPDDSYTVRTFNGQGLINQLHSGTTCLGLCDVTAGTPVMIAGGAEVSGINFDLTRGARVSGTVTAFGSGNPLPGIGVSIYDGANVRVAGGLTDGSGNFVTSEGLPAATYYARTDNNQGLVNQIYNGPVGLDCNVTCDATAGLGISLSGSVITGSVNFVLTPDADGDADGIVNTIDPQPAVFSNDFSDVAQGGTTDGAIVNRDTWTIDVGDLSPGGIKIDLAGTGTAPATFDVCALNGLQRISLDAAGESVSYSCGATTGSTSVSALNALPIVELRDPATGPGVIIQLGTGQGATTGSPVTALSTNTDTIVVIIVDATGTEIGSFELDAGESAEVVVNPDGSADAEVLEGVVEITVRGESVVLEPGETYDFPPPVVVSYTFTGFFSPVANLPAVNSQKAGSAFPVKFSLSGFQGLDVVMPGYPMSQPMSCTTWAPIGSAVTASSNGSLTYDAVSDSYAFIWRTEKAWADSCRQFELLLDDGSTHRFNVKFRK